VPFCDHRLSKAANFQQSLRFASPDGVSRLFIRVISDNGACNPRPPNADPVIIVVSDSLIFPEGTDGEPVSPREHLNALSFHVRFSDSLFYTKYSFPAAITTIDEVGHMLDANGNDTKVVQELLRHQSFKVTTDTYMPGPQ
jgi:hypothetical protein